MTSGAEAERFSALYDVERHVRATDGGILVEDPYPAFAELLDEAPVHKASIRELLGYPAGGIGGRIDAPVYSAFSYEANDIVLRENQVFSSAVYSGLVTQMFGGRTILEMVGDEHRRYRALAQPAFSPKRAQWWIDNWIGALVEEAISALEHNGRAELNAELCSRVPLQTITSSFGLTRQEALDFREGAEGGGMPAMDESAHDAMLTRHERTTAMLRRVIEDRRAQPQDDIISLLVQSEIEEDGQRHLLTDDDVYGFSRLILTAGSGTTWRQLGILFIALLREPALLDAAREDRDVLRRAIDEVVRWTRHKGRDVVRCRYSSWGSDRDESRRGQPRSGSLGRPRALRPLPQAEAEPRFRRRPPRMPRHARRAGRDVGRHERRAGPAS
jgi:cytochrome P450